MVGRVGIEPTEPLGTWFTVKSATFYGIPTHILVRHRGNDPRTPALIVIHIRFALTSTRYQSCITYANVPRAVLFLWASGAYLERVMVVETTYLAWKASVLAVELHPHINQPIWRIS